MGKRLAKRVLLVGWSSDWNICKPLLAQGLMPNLQRLMESGAGGELSAVTPLLSAPAWTSVATGKRPFKHGVHGLFEADQHVGGARPASSESRTTKAIWNILTDAGFDAHVIGWPGAHPAEPISGVHVTDQHMPARVEFGKPWPQPEGSVYPVELRSTLAPMRMHPDEIDRETLKFFVPALEAMTLGERGWLKACSKWLAASITTHAVGTWVLEHRPWDFVCLCYAGMERLLDAYLRFAPPREESVSDREFELLQHIVPAMCQFHDMMLGRLLELVGEEAVVVLVSPYGWKSGRGRARRLLGEPEDIETVRRPRGMFVIRGGTITPGSPLEPASVLDITPTVLGLLGLPIGSDMDGRPLGQVIGDDGVSAEKRIGSWDLSNGGRGNDRFANDEERARLQAVIEKLAAMGYRDPQKENLAAEQRRAVKRNRFNLARSLMEGGQVEQAVEVLRERMVTPNPSNAAMALLIEAYLILGAYEESRAVVERLQAGDARPALTELFLGRIALGCGDFQAALKHLQRATELSFKDPRAWLFVGRAHLALGEGDEARGAFERALALDPDSLDARHALVALSEPVG